MRREGSPERRPGEEEGAEHAAEDGLGGELHAQPELPQHVQAEAAGEDHREEGQGGED